MPADFDLSGLDRLAADLTMSGATVVPFVRQAVQGTALGVKKAWQGKVAGSRGLGHLAGALSYDIHVKGGEVDAEIGYDKARPQGPLGNISEFGSPGRHPPRGYGAAALHENEADFVRGIENAMADALKAHDL